ncbi:MAG: hypothetical protein LBQ94_07020 [Treponema sp.]|jgi:hypothetical protein|nr:hypothetical protein [Treponema sp.]
MPEPWDAVRKKAGELRPDCWGTPEEVAAMAAPVRKAKDRREATTILKEIAGNSPFTSKSGLTARLQRRTVGKLVSSVAVYSSFSPEAHYLAAANIDKFFSNAIEPWLFELNPNKNNEGIKARRYLFAPMEYQGRIAIIKITVKEYHAAENKLYSIEALDLVQ